jgi:rhamnose utilization protein RhaD (predicted bifunctional aldolase and dehydrogenase)
MIGFSDFLELSHYAGKSPEFTQGAGGNTSVKSDGVMWIKASGWRLAALTKDEGWTTYSLTDHRLCDHLGCRPSSEFPLHLLLGQTVLHTHPISAAVLVCAKDGESVVQALFQDHEGPTLWVSYAQPGESLKEAVAHALQGRDPKASPLVLFLQNHGLLISAPDTATAIRLHEETLATILRQYPLGEARESPTDRYLTPEQFFYTTASDRLSAQTVAEMDYFTRHVVGTIESHGGAVNWLTEDQLDALRNDAGKQARMEILQTQ